MFKLMNKVLRWFSNKETKRILTKIKKDEIPLVNSNDPSMDAFFENHYDKGVK